MDDAATPIEDLVVGRSEFVHAVHPIRFEPTPRWLRVYLAGVPVADSKRARLLIEQNRLPVYYFPVEDVRMDLLEPAGRTKKDEPKGIQSLHHVRVGDRLAERAAWMHEEVGISGLDFRGYVGFYWDRMDAWYEEDDEVYVHPRDPYHRVDVLRSSRHVKVRVLGEVVAESSRPRLLFETGLPTRYYLPRQDVRMDLLVPSDTTSQCPYKGVANYYSIRVGDIEAMDPVWYYRFPVPECPKIENLLCFFDEKVDSIEVDGVTLPKPDTPWAGKRVEKRLEKGSKKD